MSTKRNATTNKILTVIGAILCAILIPVLVINITLITKSFIHKDEVPSIGGTLPLIVLTDSMDPYIKSGDLIICKKTDAKDVSKKDVISFFDPAGNGSSIVTHRVIDIIEKDGKIYFQTMGDNNNTEDRDLVSEDKLVGVYKIRIPYAGHVALFMQSTAGLILCVVLPIVLLIGYDVLRRNAYEKTQKSDTDALLAELEALRAEKAAKEQGESKSE